MSIPTWTTQEEQLLIKRWEEGAPARDIAAELGNGYTRSAILGKVSRMRRDGVEFAVRKLAPKEGRPKGSRNKKPPNYNPAPSSAIKKPPTPIAPEIPLAPLFDTSVGILEAKESDCRAVIGHDNGTHRLAIYCGAPVVNKTSFCQGHWGRFYQRRI